MTEIFENYDIKNDTTFKIGGIVKNVAIPHSVDDLVEILSSGEKYLILGNCSNVLFSSDYVDKNIILTKKTDKILINGNKVTVECGALGAVCSNLCAKNGLSGFEFMSVFPGSFGGMITMNASAHSQAVSDFFVSAKVFNKNKNNVEILSKEELGFTYRNSKINNSDYVVLSAEFTLEKSSQENIIDKINENKALRKSTQPSLKFGNAGSIFKNPENTSAGMLLDKCGFKGVCEGGAKVFEHHANFIINYNNATSSDVLTLMYKMSSSVKEKYNIKLIPEIKYIGNENTKEYELWKKIS